MMEKTGHHNNIKQSLNKGEGFRLFLMNVPFIILLFVLCYLPLYGWRYAFFDFKPGVPLSKTDFAGLKYFYQIIQDKYAISDILRVLKNTFGMQLIGYIGAPLPMIFAIFLSEVRGRRFKKTIQTITTIPNFISWVLVYAIAYAMFSVGDGFVNKFLAGVGLIDTPINFLVNAKGIWIKMWLWGFWKGCGWSAIIYFAAISGIDEEICEAARVDGAGRFRMMWHITVPSLMPTFFVLLILSIANFLNLGMEQYYVFSNGMIRNSIEVLDLYVYNQGIVKFQYPFTTAVGMLKSMIGILLLFSANKLSKVVRGEGIM
jgi:putative aldouronate transport system permease protein